MSSTAVKADKLPSTKPCEFSLAEIESATKGFNDELVIGHGGFGRVYKGSLCIEATNHVVAIKRLDSKSDQGAPEFRAEIEMLSKLRHCHLVSLIGYCDDNKEMILVYAYMPHGTLYHHLHKAETPLNWMQRLKIAVGAARGLDYLHTGVGTHHGVIHRDMKSSNILLDENWESMISDFGLSKIGPINQSASYVDASVKGTFGYLDPEYFYTRKLTRKTDVYAFGVVLFELLSGRLPVDERNAEDECSLVRWAQKCAKERKLGQMVDPNIIKGTIFPKCLRGFAQIAERCLRSVLIQRPSMTEVVATLQGLLELQKRHDNPAEPSGIIGFTWKIHKYLVPATKQNTEQNGTSSLKNLEVFHDFPLSIMDGSNHWYAVKDVKRFTYYDLRIATGKFHDGKSCNLKFQKGWIDKRTYSPSEDNTGLPIAIKRIQLSRRVEQLDLEMLKEIFSHPNLAKLIGYCSDFHPGRLMFLVYEFMPTGNFEDLVKSGAAARLPLVTKVKIAVGIARGIVFLHKTHDQDHPFHAPISESRFDRHKILLDEDFTAKLSGYDVTKLVHGGYPPYSFCWDIAAKHSDPTRLQTNLSGFTMVFTELLTGKPIFNDDEFQKLNDLFIKHVKMSLVRSACKCFKICNEVDSESKMLKVFNKYERYIQHAEQRGGIFKDLEGAVDTTKSGH